jgi:hypothetical protein
MEHPMKLLALSLVSFIPAAFGADSASDLQGKLVGSWKLISIEGQNRATDRNSVGMLTYDSTGQMSVHIVRGERPAFPNGRARATDKEKASAFDSYTAYYGTYTFEPENGVVIHHLEGSLSPGQVGQDNIRYFELQGNRLILSVANDGKGGRLTRKETTSHLTWEKIPAK